MSIKSCVANLLVLLAGSLTVMATENTVESVYNRFIERFADATPAWKADITLGANLTNPPALPYRLHYNDSLGYYTYRPKHWEELNEYERFAVQNDPRLPHFIREEALALRTKPSPRQGANLETKKFARGTESIVEPDRRGLLTPDGPNVWGYRFEPAELLTSLPLRLVELPP